MSHWLQQPHSAYLVRRHHRSHRLRQHHKQTHMSQRAAARMREIPMLLLVVNPVPEIPMPAADKRLLGLNRQMHT